MSILKPHIYQYKGFWYARSTEETGNVYGCGATPADAYTDWLDEIMREVFGIYAD